MTKKELIRECEKLGCFDVNMGWSKEELKQKIADIKNAQSMSDEELMLHLYWEELNKMYGTDIEMPKALEEDVANFNMSDVAYEMAMGGSFDGAMQKNMEV